jgi:hypothetical protein
MTSPYTTLNDALAQIAGKSLDSVQFVLDYVQLRFAGHTLTAYTSPSVAIRGDDISKGEEGYRDALCERIGVRVAAAQADDSQLAIHFEDGAIFRISLLDKDYRGPEALQFENDDGYSWVV